MWVIGWIEENPAIALSIAGFFGAKMSFCEGLRRAIAFTLRTPFAILKTPFAVDRFIPGRTIGVLRLARQSPIAQRKSGDRIRSSLTAKTRPL
jgi:hypothetical protein